jgi:hydroxypyruvate isomerase
MLKIAANVSLLFREVTLLERFQAARAAGFDGVEIQFPYTEPASALARAVETGGFPVILINGPVTSPAYPFGIAGRPEMRDAFRAQLPQLREYAAALKVSFVHVLAGCVNSIAERENCLSTLVENLLLAAEILASCGIGVLIEPLNSIDVPNYLLDSLPVAWSILNRCEHRVALQFDAYHIARMGLDPVLELERALPSVRHVQFADVPGRHEPGTGHIDFRSILSVLRAAQYKGWLAAEYVPERSTATGLGWLGQWRSWEPQVSSTNGF